MNEYEFKQKMAQAKTFHELHGGDYYSAYMRGLRRLYHGDNFGTDEDHNKWINARDEQRRTGYADGYFRKSPKINEHSTT